MGLLDAVRRIAANPRIRLMRDDLDHHQFGRIIMGICVELERVRIYCGLTWQEGCAGPRHDLLQRDDMLVERGPSDAR